MRVELYQKVDEQHQGTYLQIACVRSKTQPTSMPWLQYSDKKRRRAGFPVKEFGNDGSCLHSSEMKNHVVISYCYPRVLLSGGQDFVNG